MSSTQNDTTLKVDIYFSNMLFLLLSVDESCLKRMQRARPAASLLHVVIGASNIESLIVFEIHFNNNNNYMC